MSDYPLFAKLNQRPVLLVGAGHVAERKAEALLKAGAKLHVVAQQLSPQMVAWQQQDLLHYLGSEFQAEQLAPVFLVVAATDDAELNRRVFQAAETAGKFCNSVDDLANCSFTVPAVIDRHPLKIAVSSSGSAPVLARLWRQKIETLLPQHTGRTAALAGRWRTEVKQKIHSLTERRKFWEQLFHHDQAFEHHMASGNESAAETLLQQRLDSHQHQPHGEVVLVGAGPGDAGLLTLNALQAMQAADVVLYDALVSREILELVRRDAEKVSVGKRAGAHQVQQEETNRLLVS